MTPDLQPHLNLLPRHRPSRSGQPWTDDDYEQLIALVREGHEPDAIAETLERSDAAIMQRLRALLPVSERKCFADRLLPTLRRHLEEQPDYPWAEFLLQSPPPAPVVRQVVERAGLSGLDDDLLVEVAWALLTCDAADDTVRTEVCRELEARRLAERVSDRCALSLMRRFPPLSPQEARTAAWQWVDEVGGRRSDHYEPWQHPW